MISNLKELKALIKLCRSHGVTQVTVAGVTLQLGEAPRKLKTEQQNDKPEVEQPYTDDDIAFWSSGGING